jgi:hypothetical protein
LCVYSRSSIRGDIILRILILACILFFFLPPYNLPQLQHEVIVRNIKVPLRVFDGERFIDDLTIKDIEILEDGKPQKIQALYLVNNAEKERMEGDRDYSPILPRNFYFVFQLTDYDSKMKEALDYFFSEIYFPGDNVDILTTYKEYSMSADAIESNTKDEVVEYINDVIRKDTQTAGKEYKKVMRDLRRVASTLSSFVGGNRYTTKGEPSGVSGGGIEYSLDRYNDALKRMESLRIVDEKRLLNFAYQLKEVDGPKIVFFFYQREFRPELNPNNVQALMASNQDRPDILNKIQELFEYYRKEENLNQERLIQAYTDSSIQFNFSYIEKKPEFVMGIVMREQSGELKDIFSKVAIASGGIADDSPYPQDSLRNTADAMRMCYILYYSPATYVPDGKFKNIEIRIKNKDCIMYYRKGYFAN